MATLMSDEIFHEVAYRTRNQDHLFAGIDEFLYAFYLLGSGTHPAIRIEPLAAIPSQEIRKRQNENNHNEELDEEEEEQKQREESGLASSGRLYTIHFNDPSKTVVKVFNTLNTSSFQANSLRKNTGVRTIYLVTTILALNLSSKIYASEPAIITQVGLQIKLQHEVITCAGLLMRKVDARIAMSSASEHNFFFITGTRNFFSVLILSIHTIFYRQFFHHT
ncbi:LOW QUALITY PROTEIN: hypothetical protein K1T71_007943 [Dendrolimus kikuchii]|uniref:Uncharacterized protein n=1 Tax=Dendrolimus kikuchii TaxID=765133 RepID=A0ACC1CYJ4_9NEOP|nr:LOW QUALITY PROTEIN: hypothetical protein K1T71_007943 [Dendrolimus kikuchii]